MYAVLAAWRIIYQALFKHWTMDAKDSPCLHARTIFKVIIVSLLSDFCACVENGVVNEAISSSVTGSNCYMRLQTCENVMGWCTAVRCCFFAWKQFWKSYSFELAHLKKRKKKKEKKKERKKERKKEKERKEEKQKYYGYLVTFWFSTSQCFCQVSMEVQLCMLLVKSPLSRHTDTHA